MLTNKENNGAIVKDQEATSNVDQNKVILDNYLNLKNVLLFFIVSIIGVLLFIVPIKIDDSWTVLIKKVADIIGLSIKEQLPIICSVILGISALFSVIGALVPNTLSKFQILKEAFVVSKFKLVLRILSFITIILVLCNITVDKESYLNFINLIVEPSTGGFVLYDLLVVLVVIFALASFFLPLLTDFGLLEFVGCLLTLVMRTLFKVPGRAAVDCITSWIGDGTVGILLTCNQYEKGKYSSREAIVIATTFSSVSITFSIVVLSQVGLMDHITEYYGLILLIGFVCAVILPRIPPLSMKKDSYLVATEKQDNSIIEKGNIFKKALELGCYKAATNKGVVDFIKSGFKNMIIMWLDVLPSVMFIGTVALFLANHTQVFDWLSVPFIPVYEFFNVPEAVEASKTVLVGFVDMFVPAIVASETITSDMTKFIIAVVSVTQLIYLSEVGGVILGSKLQIGLFGLFVIYLERTLISIAIACPVAHMIFG